MGNFFRTISNTYFSKIKNVSFRYYGMRYFFGAWLVSLAVISFSSCKDPDELGLEVLPNSDQVFVLTTDSTTLVTRTIKEDSLLSRGLSYQLLGSFDDPVFGRSDASLYTQIRLGLTPAIGQTGTLVADSLILSLAYAGYYGDTTTTQTIHIYRIGDNILTDSLYYTTKVFSLYSPQDDLANGFSFKPKPGTIINISSTDQPAQLRIPLPAALADSILSWNGLSQLADNATWIQYFKGLYIKTDPVNGSGMGAISYFDVNNVYSKLSLYYHRDTTSYQYDFTLSAATTVCHQEHDYHGIASDVGHQLSDSTFKDSLNYLQSMAGIKTKITFPYLKHFLDSGNIVVNKAELEITVQEGSTDLYASPSKLLLVYIDSSGKSFFLADFFEGASYFGGSYNSTTRTYKFNMARHLQKILNGTLNDYGLYLLASGASVQANRAILGSGKNPAYPMKLHLFYTRLH